ncbi:phosphate ABC transporter permease subunit PstC [Caulobacter sp. FWC2]|uniref:phosphate ABC transporter permease subunit PstC n=1 Tax=Caulobacter sp. FWC2 TaxID=69664 RepID=UPI000C148862|nr:phosphate ABC transporter permease subunit PstC [Caulobacter sp. FWC2]PIB94137.1 phosphate ABC transporter permease subunit PstC [Caulobacter sp. FWC2]
MLTWLSLIVLALFSGLAFAAGRRRAVAAAGGRARVLHSLPDYYGTYAALWAGIPAALLLLLGTAFGGRVEDAMLKTTRPAAVSALDPDRQNVFFSDAHAIAAKQAPSEVAYEGDLKVALDAKVAEAKRIETILNVGMLAGAGVLALAGFLLAFPRINADFRARNRVEGWTSILLIGCSVAAVLTTLGIVLSLVWESWRFFQSVNPLSFLFGTEWSPQIAMRADQVASAGAFGAVPLFAGTFLIMFIAMLVAAPVGLYSAIYLSEYASRTVRGVVKPLLEILAGVPTVVYGFFAALTVGPLFRAGINAIGAALPPGPLATYLMEVQNQMALVAGVVMGIMLIPFVSSLSDDIINAVPQSLRDGSYAMGATKSETVKKVVLPAALPGIMAAMLLAMSRAVGETMIVTMAAGLQAKMTVNPLDTVTTVTVQIVTLLTGDQEFDSPKTLSAFGLGLTLFVVTLCLNIIALRIVQKYREQYD